MNGTVYAHTNTEHSMHDCIEACSYCHQVCEKHVEADH